MKSISLFYKDSTSDKEYNVQLQPQDDGYVVNFSYGRRGNALQSGTKTSSPVPLDKATTIYDKLVSEKVAKGYVTSESGKPFSGIDTAGRNTGLFPMLMNPISKSEMDYYINSSDWIMQEKFDGKRIMISVSDGLVIASNRKGLSVGIPEEVENEFRDYPDCVIDGELVGSTYYMFDLIENSGRCLRSVPYLDRLLALCDLIIRMVPPKNSPIIVASWYPDKQSKLNALPLLQDKEGVVFKLKNAPWRSGRPNSGGDQFKCKFWESATVQVLSINDKRSVSVGVLDGNEVVNVGNVSIPPNYDIPSVGDMCEVKYLYAYKGGSIYQPIYKGIRDDKDAPDTIDSLKYKIEDN